MYVQQLAYDMFKYVIDCTGGSSVASAGRVGWVGGWTGGRAGLPLCMRTTFIAGHCPAIAWHCSCDARQWLAAMIGCNENNKAMYACPAMNGSQWQSMTSNGTECLALHACMSLCIMTLMSIIIVIMLLSLISRRHCVCTAS